MSDTTELALLPGEGDEKTVKSRRVRRECDECGEPAAFKHTYLLPDARRNPASSGYRGDDISWCSDAERFTCAKCRRPEVDGYGWCASFPAERFAHMFLHWVEVKPSPLPAPVSGEAAT